MPPPDAPGVPEAGVASAPAAAADHWTHLRRYTAARIALGRSGGSQRTDTVLDFRLSHARARDAVLSPFDVAALLAGLAAAGITARPLRSAAADRKTYLLRPDLGRRLDLDSRAELENFARAHETAPDLAVIISDGLAAAAAERHALSTLAPLARNLRAAGWRLAPVFVVPFARVKIQDEIGSVLGARYTLMLLGERPGLGTPDSLGAYFTKNPIPERTDADRNCLSNIRPEGLPPAHAAAKLLALLLESARTGLAGVHLKDMSPAQSLPPAVGKA